MNITGGIYNGRKIKAPDEKVVRPTLSKIRMSIFNTLYSIVGDFSDKSFLDMFGGSGIMGLEALSRGFKDVVVFEKNKTVANIIKENYNSLGLYPNIYIGDSIKLLNKVNKNFDVIYIDPPYMSDLYEKCLLKLQENTFKNSIIILEHSKNMDLKDFKILKEKTYGDKSITFLSKNNVIE